jgi:hypothetical protein
MAAQKKEPPTLLEDKLPPSLVPSAPAQESQQFFGGQYQQVAPNPQPHFPPPHFQQQIHQGVPPDMQQLEQHQLDPFSSPPPPPPPFSHQGPPSIYAQQDMMNASYSSPPSIPLPPPGSLQGAPKYDMGNNFNNRNADDEWVVIDNNAPSYPTIQQAYPGFDPSHSQVVSAPFPPSPYPQAPATSMSMSMPMMPPMSMSASSTSSAPYPGAPSTPQMIGGAPGQETIGFLYPTVHDPSHLAESRIPSGPAPVYMVQGHQLHDQRISKNQFHPFAQQTHAVVTFAPFELSAEAANDIYVKWKESLWFIPADFGSKSCEAGLRPVLMPYYLFDMGLTTNYEYVSLLHLFFSSALLHPNVLSFPSHQRSSWIHRDSCHHSSPSPS